MPGYLEAVRTCVDIKLLIKVLLPELALPITTICLPFASSSTHSLISSTPIFSSLDARINRSMRIPKSLSRPKTKCAIFSSPQDAGNKSLLVAIITISLSASLRLIPLIIPASKSYRSITQRISASIFAIRSMTASGSIPVFIEIVKSS